MSYVVSVRSLCEFAARRGSLDLRFHIAPTGQEGIVGHRIVMARRPAPYEKEVSLQAEYGLLTVRGRADGFDPVAGRLEEIKTHRGRLRDIPEAQSSLHWAQAKLYGHLMCHSRQLETIDLALVYFNITNMRETIRTQQCTASDLRQHFQALCNEFVAWAEQELQHRDARNAALRELRLPFDGFREGQRALAKAVYRGVRDGAHLAVQAPTGIGKTMGTLFPALKAMPEQNLDKLYFLTAKTSGRKVALDALQTMQGQTTMPLRVLELASRDHACEHPDKHCHGESCPLAQGFYDKLGNARKDALKASHLDRPMLRHHALEHSICPYHLGFELIPWSDVVVGDYNYYFDVGATLHGRADANDWNIAVLIDEAHNLVERARRMYSASLRQQDLQALQETIASKDGGAALTLLVREWGSLARAQSGPYQAHGAPPASFVRALQQAVQAVADYLENEPDSTPEEVLRFYFDAHHFLRMAESFGPHSVFDTTKAYMADECAPAANCCIRNVVPATFLKPRFETAHSCVLFSATLQPWAFYADMLGMPDSTTWTDIASPFHADQLGVHVVCDISTRYADREASLDPIAEIIARQYSQRPGNYLVFSSSFDYLHRLADTFTRHHQAVPIWIQSRGMDSAARTAFLARFDESTSGIGFAVLGGVFAEGVDLPGNRLIGAFIATLGLPQVNPVNEALKACLNDGFAGRGYDYAYLYPGLRKVVQAAGRVIRTPKDAGVVYLIDDRYNRPVVQRLLPPWWRVSVLPAQDAESNRHVRDTCATAPGYQPARIR